MPCCSITITGSSTVVPARDRTTPCTTPESRCLRSISAASTGPRSPRDPTCSHASNWRDSPGCRRVPPEQVLRTRPEVIEVGRMQRNRPVHVVRHDTIGERTLRFAFLQGQESGHSEKIAGAGPQRLAGQQVSECGGAGVRHRRTDLDAIRVRAQHVRRYDRDLAPVASCPHRNLVRPAIQHVDLLIGIRPCRPVVRDEIREHDAIQARLAVGDRCHIDDRPARNAIRHRAFNGDPESQLLVHERDVARCAGFAIDDRGRSDDQLRGAVADDGKCHGSDQCENGGSARAGRHRVSRYRRARRGVSGRAIIACGTLRWRCCGP